MVITYAPGGWYHIRNAGQLRPRPVDISTCTDPILLQRAES